MAKQEIKLIANNKKAHHDYFLEEKYEAGVELHGTEVKSLRMGKCSIKEAFVRIEKGEVIIYGMHISPYEKGNIFNKDPLRPRRLLMHKREIMRLYGKVKQDHLFITYSTIDPSYVELVRQTVEETMEFKEIHTTNASCTIACHCGPNTLGILFETE